LQHQRGHHSLLLPAILAFACGPGEGGDGLSAGSPGQGTLPAGSTSVEGTSSSTSSSAEPGSTGGSGTEAAPNASGDTTTAGAPESTTGAAGSTSGDTSGDTSEDTSGEAPADPSNGSSGSSGSSGDGPGDEGTTGGPGMGDAPPPPTNAPDENLLVALVGDMGAGSAPKAVYQRVLDEGADLLIVLGDFDYGDDPAQFFKDMEGVLGGTFPVFGVIGNHDVAEWDGYQSGLKARLAKVQGAACTGDLGVDSSCKYRGLHFVLSGVGTIGTKAKHEQYIADALAADDSLWSLCIWHKNMRDLQAGDKSDDVGWPAFKHCQKEGAPIVMGHEHSYARTRALTDIGNKGNGHGATGLPELLEVGPGRTFTVVSGLGGKSIRAYEDALHKDDQWWATLYASDYHRQNGVEKPGASGEDGVLFMRFNVDGDAASAHGYFKTVKGEVIDEFDVVKKQ
jgi:hypothetical protein